MGESMSVEERLQAIEQYIAVLKEQGIGMPDMTVERLTAMSDEEVAGMLTVTTFPQPKHGTFPDSYLTELLPRRVTENMSILGKLRYRDLPKGYPLCPQCGRPLELEGRYAACPHCREEYLKFLEEGGLHELLREAQIMFKK